MTAPDTEMNLCRWYLEAIDELLRGKALHHAPQEKFGVIIGGAVGQVGDLSLGRDNDAVGVVSADRSLCDEGIHEAG